MTDERCETNAMDRATFELREPSRGCLPVIVEVPHASVVCDPESMAYSTAPLASVGRDADLYVDELVRDVVDEGASLLVARLSRHVIDLNRDLDDIDAASVEGARGASFPRGLLWRLTSEGFAALAAPVPRAELQRRLALIYHPYHTALDDLVRRRVQRFGLAVVLSMHSMPSSGPSKVLGRRLERSDIVIGTRARTTAAHELIRVVEEHARSYGFSVAHDDPYRGGATTGRLGDPSHGKHAIQVEMARRVYMEESTLSRIDARFNMAMAFCRGLVAKVGVAALG